MLIKLRVFRLDTGYNSVADDEQRKKRRKQSQLFSWPTKALITKQNILFECTTISIQSQMTTSSGTTSASKFLMSILELSFVCMRRNVWRKSLFLDKQNRLPSQAYLFGARMFFCLFPVNLPSHSLLSFLHFQQKCCSRLVKFCAKLSDHFSDSLSSSFESSWKCQCYTNLPQMMSQVSTNHYKAISKVNWRKAVERSFLPFHVSKFLTETQNHFCWIFLLNCIIHIQHYQKNFLLGSLVWKFRVDNSSVSTRATD